MSDRAENMIISALDQSWAACVGEYRDWTPEERGELAEWIIGHKGDISSASTAVLKRIQMLASTAFMETGLRWAKLEQLTIE